MFNVNLTLCSQGLDLDNGTDYIQFYMTIQCLSFLSTSRQPSKLDFPICLGLKTNKLTSILKGP